MSYQTGQVGDRVTSRLKTRHGPILKEGRMKLLFFDDFKLGVLKGDTVVDVSAVVRDIPHTGPHNLISALIESFADYRGSLEKAGAARNGAPLAKVRIP